MKRAFSVGMLCLLVLSGGGCRPPVPPSAPVAVNEPVKQAKPEEIPSKPLVLEETFTASVHMGLPDYRFVVRSYSTSSQGTIVVYRGNEPKPVQTIELDPNARFAWDVVPYFEMRDVNFDGYIDIGVPKDGGVVWISYQYWTFDPAKGLFVSSPFAKDLEKVSYNRISFDEKLREIRTFNLIAAVGHEKRRFTVRHDRLVLIEEVSCENIDETHSEKRYGKEVNGVFKKTREELPHMCGLEGAGEIML